MGVKWSVCVSFYIEKCIDEQLLQTFNSAGHHSKSFSLFDGQCNCVEVKVEEEIERKVLFFFVQKHKTWVFSCVTFDRALSKHNCFTVKF